MKQFLKNLFGPFLTRIASNAAAPDKKEVHKSLSGLLLNLRSSKGKKGLTLDINFSADKIIVLSDHHKGNKDYGDDFATNEANYLAALEYYLLNEFIYINLGDAEELWKYSPDEVISKNIVSLRAEAKFQAGQRYYKTFGNHDVTWKTKLDVDIWFKNIYTLPLTVWEGILLKGTVNSAPLSILLTHGHQGDKSVDNTALATWILSHIWRPIQRYLEINVNTPAKDFKLKNKHNIMMYEWSSDKKDLLLITGHTHKPVFASGKYSDHESNKIGNVPPGDKKVNLIPSYFNTGCCCYNDGDITGIEIAGGKISLIKWHLENNVSGRIVLEEASLHQVAADLSS